MKAKRVACAIPLAGGFSYVACVQPPPAPWHKYLWQTSRTTDVPASTSNLVAEFRFEVQKVLEAGPLAPVRTVYADLEQDPYFMYWQGGRIITTLAMAWPLLSDAQRISATDYVRAELDDERR